MRTPVWALMVPFVLGAVFIIASLVLLRFAGLDSAGGVVAVIWLPLGIVMALLTGIALRRRAADDRVARGGIPAEATLLAASATGWNVNNVPQWKLRVRVEGAGDPYEATLKMLTFAPPGDGERLSVRIDPRRRAHVVLASGAPAATQRVRVTPAMDANDGERHDAAAPHDGTAHDAAETVRLLGELDRMRASGALADGEFDAMKKKLIGEA